jgi:hypothetical protein
MRRGIVMVVVALGVAALIWYGGGTVVGWLRAMHGH